MSRIRHRMRRVGRRDYGIDRYSIEARLARIYDDCRTVEELRERLRSVVDDDTIWEAIADIQDTSLRQTQALRNLEAVVNRAFPVQKPRRKKAA